MSFEFTLLDRLHGGAAGVPAHPPGRAGHGAGAGPLYAGGPLRLKAAVRTPAPLRPPAGDAHAGGPAAWLVLPFRTHVLRLWLQNRRLGAPALALAGFIGFTRMYLYVHFPTDILGGVALGLALGACGSLLADKISNKWAKRSEVKRAV